MAHDTIRQPDAARPFHAAARRVRRRLMIAAWFEGLNRTGPVIFAIALLILVGLRLAQVRWHGLDAAIGLTLLWAAAMWLLAWLRRPTPEQALARWDDHADRAEAFLSALCFEQEAQPSDGQRLHLQRAAALLPAALPRLHRDLPAALRPQALLAPIVLLLFAATPWLIAPLPPEDQPLDAAALQRVALAADAIEQRRADLDALRGLTEPEQKKLDDLRRQLEDTAARMKQQDDQTSRSVLSQLEQLAREAESLARQLGDMDSQPLSSKMIEELERHADTADLGAALRVDQPEQIAAESRELADTLRNEDRTIEQTQRIGTALRSAMKVADDQDRQTLPGRHLDQADQQMQRDAPEQAAEQFEELARRMEHRRQREMAQQRVEQLAEAARAAGQRAMGREGEGMRQLDQAAGEAAQPMDGRMMPLLDRDWGRQDPRDGQDRDAGRRPPRMRMPFDQDPGEGGRPPIPGLAEADWGDLDLNDLDLDNLTLIPGGMDGMPVGMIPIPGTPAAGAGGDDGGMPGGLEAGHGTAGLGEQPTDPLAPTGTGVVNIAPVNPGASRVRTVEGQHRPEAVAREARELALEMLQAQEDALADEPLPLSRRDQVLRYFTLVRMQLEQQPPR